MLVLWPDFAEAGRTMKKLFPVVALLLVVGAVVVGCDKPADSAAPAAPNAPAVPDTNTPTPPKP